MKKETIIAIVFGVIFGGAVAVTLVFATPRKEPGAQTNIPVAISITPAQHMDKQTIALEVMKPTDGLLVTTNTTQFVANVGKESLVLLQSPTFSKAVKAEGDVVTIDMPLSLGENKILVTVFNKEKPQIPQEKEMSIYYLDEN